MDRPSRSPPTVMCTRDCSRSPATTTGTTGSPASCACSGSRRGSVAARACRPAATSRPPFPGAGGSGASTSSPTRISTRRRSVTSTTSARRSRAGDRLILCTAKPSWADGHEPDAYRNLAYVERNLVPDHCEAVLMISGDSHHYARYRSDTGTREDHRRWRRCVPVGDPRIGE